MKCKDERMAINILLKSLVIVILTHKSRCLESLISAEGRDTFGEVAA